MSLITTICPNDQVHLSTNIFLDMTDVQMTTRHTSMARPLQTFANEKKNGYICNVSPETVLLACKREESKRDTEWNMWRNKRGEGEGVRKRTEIKRMEDGGRRIFLIDFQANSWVKNGTTAAAVSAESIPFSICLYLSVSLSLCLSVSLSLSLSVFLLQAANLWTKK